MGRNSRLVALIALMLQVIVGSAAKPNDLFLWRFDLSSNHSLMNLLQSHPINAVPNFCVHAEIARENHQ